jgi:hypothetical protein
MNVPGCAVFTLDGGHKIRQLAIYMDRYRMMDQLATSHWTRIELPEHAHPPRAAVREERGRRITITID